MNKINLPESVNSIEAPDIITLDTFLKKGGYTKNAESLEYYLNEKKSFCEKGCYYLAGQVLIKRTDKLTNELLQQCIDYYNENISKVGVTNSFELASINSHNFRFKVLIDSLNLYYESS